MSTTATVETLTAEVRVLMVSNRQVTLSVARQLDAYEYEYDDEALDFTPFGRVRIGTKGEKSVVCGSSAKGAEWLPNRAECAEPLACTKVGHARRVFNGKYQCGRFERWESVEYDYQWIGRHNSTGSLVIVSAFVSGPPDTQFPEEWSNLPLIILAGLR